MRRIVRGKRMSHVFGKNIRKVKRSRLVNEGAPKKQQIAYGSLAQLHANTHQQIGHGFLARPPAKRNEQIGHGFLARLPATRINKLAAPRMILSLPNGAPGLISLRDLYQMGAPSLVFSLKMGSRLYVRPESLPNRLQACFS